MNIRRAVCYTTDLERTGALRAGMVLATGAQVRSALEESMGQLQTARWRKFDPDVQLESLRRTAVRVADGIADPEDLVEDVLVLDTWLKRGGKLPRAWTKRGAA